MLGLKLINSKNLINLKYLIRTQVVQIDGKKTAMISLIINALELMIGCI